MRLSSRDLHAVVTVAPQSIRPIRLRACGLTYMFAADEAIDLATKLADAVDELNEGKTP